MRYKPERALTPIDSVARSVSLLSVEMRYKPERALTLKLPFGETGNQDLSRNEV